MGKTAVDTQREIEQLRQTTDVMLGELEQRIKLMFDVSLQARRHPLVTSSIALAFTSGLGLLVYALFLRPRQPSGWGKR
ncbi:MAG: hypothetical protein HY675_24290 [Chloroflexi bacterium]|nr:hypothetical protein [Chloroflexota bacterium]